MDEQIDAGEKTETRQNFEVSKELIQKEVRQTLINLQVMQEYGDNETPLDNFDSECHDCPGGIIKSRDRLTEDDIVFMINVSEQVKRSADMLMFLGEYFKEVIFRTEKINDAITKDKQNVSKQQSDFYITKDILNYLGTASKMFIENPRQELRISIALARSPTF